nr:hypothetical protein [Tanacetum cinerariifolium]
RYILMMDYAYALLDVIENGPSLQKTQVVEGITTLMPITSVEDKAQRRLKVKARSTLMMGIPNEHQLNFNSIKDAKQMMEAIEKRFDLHTMSLDDLYKNLKVYEPEVKEMSSSNSSTQNMAFVYSSNNNNTNGAVNTTQAVNTALRVSTFGTQVNTANNDNLSDAIICAFLASQPKARREHFAREYKAPRSQDTKIKENTRRTVHVETPASTALIMKKLMDDVLLLEVTPKEGKSLAKVDDDPSKGSKCKDQEQDDNVNSTNNVNAASTNRVNAVSGNISNELPFDLHMPALEDISTFNFSSDHKDDDEEADMNKIDTTIQVSPVPTTRIHKDHPLDQMDIKSAFLYEKIEKKEYVCQPPGFEDLDFLDKVYKVKNHYMDYIKLLEHDDIIFGSTKKELCIAFEKMMHEKFQMKVKNTSTPMETQKPLLKDEDVCAYARYQVNPKVSHLHAVKRIFSARNIQRLQIPQQKYNMWLLQFWTSAKARTINEEAQIHAKVDGKKATPNESSSQGTDSGDGPRYQDTMRDTIAQTRVFDLEKTKTTQALEIDSLKRRVKKLEKKQRSRTHKLKRLYKVGLFVRVESFDDNEDLGEDASK